MLLYRYNYRVIRNRFTAYPEICLEEFKMLKETPQGFWIEMGPGLKRWVPKYGKNLYAFSDKDKALFNFKKRKRKQLKILKSQVNIIENVLQQIGRI